MKKDSPSHIREESIPETQWQRFTYDELCSELKGIKELPEKALEAIATAVFLCASLPGPVRKAWKRARGPLYSLLAAFVETDFDPAMMHLLFEIRTRLDERRNYRLIEASSTGESSLLLVGPDNEPRTVDCYEEPVEHRSQEVGFERFPSVRGVREHYADFIVICAGVLQEAGYKVESESRRGGTLRSKAATNRSVFAIMVDLLDIAWSDSARDERPRSIETVRDAYKRAMKNLPKDFPGAPDQSVPSGRSMIELLKVHREKRGAHGLGAVWLRR